MTLFRKDMQHSARCKRSCGVSYPDNKHSLFQGAQTHAQVLYITTRHIAAEVVSHGLTIPHLAVDKGSSTLVGDGADECDDS